MSESRQGLAGTLALLAATTVALFALALLDDDVPPPGVPAGGKGELPLDPEQLLEIGLERTPDVAARVERIRGLGFRRVPKPRVSGVAELRRLVERDLSRPKTRRNLRVDEVELRLLGLLADDESLRQVTSDYTALAAAYYEPRTQRLFLIGDAIPAGPGVTEFVLAHELTHALEDERFGLHDSKGLTDDEALADAALTEGSATSVMQVYATRHLDALDLIAEAGTIDAGGIELPDFAEAQAEFTYSTGAAFVDKLRRVAKGWALVDYAFTNRAPSTTEQIIHPEKFIAGEEAQPVRIPAAPGPDWTRSDSGTIGEWATRQLLIEGEPGLAASTAAAGWGGDRLALFTRQRVGGGCVTDCRRDHAMALHWRYDTPTEAKELAKALEAYVKQALGGTATDDGWQLEGGWAALERSGSRVGLGLGPSETIAGHLAASAR